MSTFRTSVDEIKIGDIVAEDLFTDHTYVSLVVKNTVINQRVLDKLKEMDIDTILIRRSISEDDSVEVKKSVAIPYSMKKVKFKENYKEKVSDVKDIFKSILNEGTVDLEKISSVSNDIFENIDDIYVAIESIGELKDFDEYTYIHSVNVALYSMLIAKWINLDENDIKLLVKAAVFHDIGKAKVDDKILNKPGSLTDEEFFEMRKHPTYGYELCKDMDDIDDEIKNAILSHHEKIDGSGYPRGLKDDDISLFAKIIAVCDVYDAITSKKVYKDKITPFESFDEIINHGYGKLDTNIMLTFLNNIRGLYVGLKVRMNTGEIGEIVFIPNKKMSKPVVKIGSMYYDLSKDHNYKIEEIV